MKNFKYNENDYLLLQADRKLFSVLREWLTQVTESLKFPPKVMKQILIASDELYTNIVSYAYPSNKAEKPVEIYLLFDEKQKKFIVTFKDYGVAFNPIASTPENPQKRVQDKLVGGLGLFLVHTLMDDIQYKRLDGANLLSIIKKIDSTPKITGC